jgi:hypothetical protein
MKNIFKRNTDKIYILKQLVLIVFMGSLSSSCNKEFLEEKPSQSLVVPSSLKDFQSLLDNSDVVFNGGYAGLGEVASDNFYVTDNIYAALSNLEKNAYVWNADVFNGSTSITEWNRPYQQVYYSNIVLEGLKKISTSSTTQSDYDNIKGSALFYRAYSFYDLSQIFAKPYNNSTSETDLGIPLRLTTSLTDAVPRSSIAATYRQITSDLITAKDLLPITPLYKTRPSKPSTFALLARVSLAMQDYVSAGKWADSALQVYNTLNDFNTLNASAAYPIAVLSNEMIFLQLLITYSSLNPTNATVDSTLYQSYQTNDLRKTIFFKSTGGRITFSGSYYGSANLFCGLATDELLLIRAECNARKGDVAGSMADLNALLIKRWKTGFFVPLTASSADDALLKILAERRKELCFRGLRWTDLRRLNQETRFSKSLTRIVNNQTYTLLPNDNRYVYPIPENEMLYNPVQQNPR